MRGTFLFVVILMLLAAFGCEPASRTPGALARVDGKVITLEDFNRRFEEMKLESEYAPGGHEALMAMKKEFLDQLIEEALILQAAKRLGISVSEEELEQEIMNTKDDYRGESLREYLTSQGISFEAWRERVKERMLIEKSIRTHCHFDGTISTDEARAYYEAHRDEYVLPEQVKARQIVVASKRSANRLLGELEKGADFEDLAVTNSLGPEARFGGDLGYFARGDMPEEFSVVFSMDIGEISDAVESPYGFHIFKVDDKRPGRQLALEDVLDDVKRKIAQTKSEQLYYQWLEELERNAKIDINTRLLEYTH
jgi:peptidyl-prolyl cis-trans isomerase C